MGADGTVTLKDGFMDSMHMGPDFVGLQATDDPNTDSPILTPGSTLMVLQLNKKTPAIDIQLQGFAQLKLTKDNSFLATNGTFTVQTAGMPKAAEHVTTAEAVANILNGVLLGLAGLAAPGALSTLATPAVRSGILATAIATCMAPVPGVGGVLDPAVASAISAALLTKLPDPDGTIPNIGCPGFLTT
jgi:hypothetical protein